MKISQGLQIVIFSFFIATFVVAIARADTNITTPTYNPNPYGYLGQGDPGTIQLPTSAVLSGGIGSGNSGGGTAPTSTLQTICEAESNCNYSTDTGNGAYGAYQFQMATLQTLGCVDSSGNFTGSSACGGASSMSDFLSTPSDQDTAAQALLQLNQSTMSANGDEAYVGQTITVGGQQVTVTQTGLDDAAWLYGVGGVNTALTTGQNVQYGDSNPPITTRLAST